MTSKRQPNRKRRRARVRIAAALAVAASTVGHSGGLVPCPLGPPAAAAQEFAGEISAQSLRPIRLRLESAETASPDAPRPAVLESVSAETAGSASDEAEGRIELKAGRDEAEVAPDSDQESDAATFANSATATPPPADQTCGTCELPPVACRCSPAVDCAPWWGHRSGLFGEFLLLRPGSTDLIYAVEQTDPDPDVASPTGPIGIVNVESEPGFRVGFSHAASDCSSLVASYTWWQGDADSSLTATGGNVLASTVFHPSTATSGAASLQASADQRIRFQTADVAYRHLWKASQTTALNWIGGLRYGNVSQTLGVDQTVQVANGLTSLRTEVDFDGFGISGGLDFERYSSRSGLSIYGRTLASLLAGEWDASYRQTNQFGGGVVANTYEDFRVTPVLEAELGLAWTSPRRRLRAHAGMRVSGWYDAVTTRRYVGAVRSGALTDFGETMTFSGLSTGLAWRY